MRRMLLTAAGVVLVWSALGALGYIGGWQLHVQRAAATLARAEHALSLRAQAASRGRSTSSTEGCVVTATSTGQLAGILEIPAIHLSAPVEEGTTDAVLRVAVGHDPASVWPGRPGTAALLAHDVSYFVHLGTLGPGDVILYRTACSTTRFVVTRSQVVAQGSAIPNTPSPSLVLDTCYPSNALFFTPQRLVVWASEVSQRRAAWSGKPQALRPSLTGQTAYSLAAPAPLAAQGLTLQQNEAPMGTMTLSGQTSARWEQSPGPLALEGAALEAYFGGLRASAQGEQTWWRAIAAPNVSPPAPLIGARVSGHDAPLNVDIVSVRGVPTQVVLTTAVTLTGGSAPGAYAERVEVDVQANHVVLGGWTLEVEGTK